MCSDHCEAFVILIFIVIDKHVVIIVKHLELLTFKYVGNYMLIYVKILKLSDHLHILHADA